MIRKADLDNHSRQLDPEHDAYWRSRGWTERPNDWKDRLDSNDVKPAQD